MVPGLLRSSASNSCCGRWRGHLSQVTARARPGVAAPFCSWLCRERLDLLDSGDGARSQPGGRRPSAQTHAPARGTSRASDAGPGCLAGGRAEPGAAGMSPPSLASAVGCWAGRGHVGSRTPAQDSGRARRAARRAAAALSVAENSSGRPRQGLGTAALGMGAGAQGLLGRDLP